MSDKFVEHAKAGMGSVERLIKGLPGIRDYVDKELRREADKRVRDLISDQLEEQKKNILELQQKLLKGGGLALLDDVDGAVQKLQTLIDRVKHASYGYAGLFDAVKIREEQLDALHRFDVALMGKLAGIENAVKALAGAISSKGQIESLIAQLTDTVGEVATLFSKRNEAIIAPDLLTNAGYAPSADSGLPASVSTVDDTESVG